MRFAANRDRLVRSCAETGRLNATGHDVLRRVTARHQHTSEALDAYVAEYPDVAARPLHGAVVITGLPRTGTTLLHNLLALDPSFRALRVWEGLSPLPDGDRVARAQRWLDAFYALVPEFRTIHPATATGPEECDVLLQNAFASQHFDDMFDAREYSAWLATAPLTEEYEHYAMQLRVLSSPAGDPWLLKSPGHLGHLDALLTVLPDCSVILCHRDPREAVASWASLIHTLRGAYSDTADAEAVGAEALARATTATARAQQARTSSFVDVDYRRLVAAPVGAVHELYEHLGRPLDPAVAKAIDEWVDAHPAGRHDYDLARFGLTADAVDAAFAPYRLS
ncbi:MAG: sulfotransferase family protein [Acidimicrobiales bacterium]